MARVIDCDMHLFETHDMWERYSDPGARHLALRLAEDELGHTWLYWGSEQIGLALHQVPGDTSVVGEQMRRVRAGMRAEHAYRDITPDDYEQPAARLRFLDTHDTDAAVLFPNYGLLWERRLAGDLDAVKVNMGAWNRWAVDVTADGEGRLFPVAHLSLRDIDWLDSQLATLAAGGVRAAMIAPALVDGKPLSHPDLDRAWAAFVHHGITPVFHVGNFQRPFDDAWYADDPDDGNPVLSSVFLGTTPALALADLAVHGAFERHPDLRIGVMELSAIWVPLFLLTLDGGFEFHAKFNGEPLTVMPRKPSEYIRSNVRVAAFAYEAPDRLIAKAGDLFMYCSDYPHSEGTDHARDDYRRMSPRAPGPDEAPGLFGENVAWLLRL